MTKRKQVPGVLGRIVATGLGALFLTEEGIRKGMSSLGLPRDASQYVLNHVERRKEEMMQVLRDELHQALSKVPFDRIAKEVLKENDIELVVRFVPRKRAPSRQRAKLTHRGKSTR